MVPLRSDAVRNRARILAAAEAVFAERGVSTSTEEVAAAAGVAVGTVFRHFPTKDDLLAAIMKDLLAGLTERLTALAADADAATALFTFFTELVDRAAGSRTVVEALGIELAPPLQTFQDAVAHLLERAQEAGAVRADVRVDEVMALLLACTQGAVQGRWDPDLRERTLQLIFAGLRTAAPGSGRLGP
ncbi:TetR/AcrR family transcriptional regulator [Pseudonocardia sp. TRM90224]|uniref:TetR/AcrR family transcriptional regulator n=1 Tax=Pseudonocardia sp. TRM90224 TaxID=2812678 RepID=UPI001E3ADD3A|nr:TetR/AcrR family transcriptional regulator [Pseudonocardia sp. TRM90224]